MTDKEAYFKLCEALHQLPDEYQEAMEIALDILQQKISANGLDVTDYLKSK